MTHALAKFARSLADFVVWLEDSPDWLDEPLLFDSVLPN